MCYSPRMTMYAADRPDETDLNPGYPSAGARIGPAWREVWQTLHAAPGEWHDGAELWRPVAHRHGLAASTLRALMFRMAKNGRIESTTRSVSGVRGPRTRAQFRVPAR